MLLSAMRLVGTRPHRYHVGGDLQGDLQRVGGTACGWVWMGGGWGGGGLEPQSLGGSRDELCSHWVTMGDKQEVGNAILQFGT